MKITTICIGILVFASVSLALSGFLSPDVPDVPDSDPMPTPTSTTTVTPTAIPTATLPSVNDSGNSSNESLDNKSDQWLCDHGYHNASWCQANGYWGMFSSSSGSNDNSPPPDDPSPPIPEMLPICMVVYGIFFVTMFYVGEKR